MNILNFLINKRNILISLLSLLILLFHYNSIQSRVESIEIEKGKRETLISNLIMNNINYNLSFLRSLFINSKEVASIESKEPIVNKLDNDFLQDVESRFNLNYYYEKLPSSNYNNIILPDQNNRYFLILGKSIHVRFSSSLPPYSEEKTQLKITPVSLLSLNFYQLDSHKNRYFHLIKVPFPALNGDVLVFDDITSSAIELKNELQDLVKVLLLLLASYILFATFAQYQHNTNIELASDSLTGLKNRAYLQSANVRLKHDHLKHACICVIVIDLDHFKDINDQYGHPTGDDILIRVASILADNVRSNDECYRIGGDEFIVIVKSQTLSDTKKLAERLREKIAEDERLHVMSKGGISASLGLAVMLPNQPIEEVVSIADEMLYQAKRQGRNLVQSYI